ncbi:hypothetical protein IscW_ISCW007804 [Ixodes scapularis]|uniref:Uncharacterized protein n=1 Tax=Ixodes scapularis TaxID=6945 RepID=B7PW51_IXOSC|nr:hypothetical protein IscW_ISCW007804 [Ixodes scapularis]|eukprot:XP_002409302.1 hypothetical protein IscW_ISCW007804 [Ixodes scapularis]
MGLGKRRHLAGPHAYDRQRLRDTMHSETILEKIIAQTQHVVLRLRVISVRCGPQSGIEVSVSSSPQQQDFYPSTLVRDRKWHNLSGSFREVCLARMQGRSFLSKMEHLMAALTT